MANNKKNSVIGSFRFLVEMDGLLVGGFSEVSGLEAQTETEEFSEGGVNSYVHILPKGTKFTPIVFKRGMTSSSELWDWYSNVMIGKIKRKNGSIILQNQMGKEICRWNFYESYPKKWVGPQMESQSNQVAIETLEIVHNGFKVVFKK